MTDKEFLQWLHERLIRSYGANPNVDWMHRLREVIGGIGEVMPIAGQPGYIKIVRNNLTGEYRYLVMGDNHEVLSNSEYFTTKAALDDTVTKYYSNWEVKDESGNGD